MGAELKSTFCLLAKGRAIVWLRRIYCGMARPLARRQKVDFSSAPIARIPGALSKSCGRGSGDGA